MGADNAGKVFEDQILVNPDIDLVFAHSGAPDRADRRRSWKPRA